MTRKRKNATDSRSKRRDCSCEIQNGMSNDWGSEFMQSFERRYGHAKNVGRYKKKYLDKQKFNSSVRGPDSLLSRMDYPSELVSYMKHIVNALKENPSESGDLQRRCLEECEGSEIALCMYDVSSRLVVEIFSNCHDAAKHWMSVIMKSEVNMQLQVLYMPWACRTLEALLPSLSNTLDGEIIGHWVDVVVQNWNQLVIDKSASRFIRSLTYHLVGLTKRSSVNEEQFPMKNSSPLINVKLDAKSRERFGKIARMAMHYASMKDYLDDESVSLVLQNVVECDSVVRGGYIQEFVNSGCHDPISVVEQWKGKQSSRLWQVLVQKTGDDLCQHLYHSVLEGKLFDLALHGFANFPLQSYIASAKSDELITDVFDELIVHFEDICDNSKWGVITALIRIARNENEVVIVKKLRSYFKCNSRSTRSAFVPSVFTLVSYESFAEDGAVGIFDVTKGQLHGSVILQELLKFKHNKTVVSSLKSLTDITVLELAKNNKGSLLLQALFRSPAVLMEDKKLIAIPLKHKWRDVMSGNFSSYVFDSMWENDIYSIKEKESLMDALLKTTAENRQGMTRLMCMKLNLRGFKEHRARWLKQAQAKFKE